MSAPIEKLVEAVAAGKLEPCYLVVGDRVLAEPQARRLADALASRLGCEPQVHYRPSRLGDLLADLRTYSLFDPAKVVVVVESALMADLGAAADLLDEAIEALPVDAASESLSPRERHAALRLLQAFRLFQLDPYAGAAERAIEGIPDWALAGGAAAAKGRRGRARPKPKIARLRTELAVLLDLARAAELVGKGESDSEELAAILRDGLPEGHALVLAESSVADKHPLLQELAERGAVARGAGVDAGRGGEFSGLDAVCRELERLHGVRMSAAAARELARRTLRTEARSRSLDADTTARFAAEYAKLAALSGGAEIDAELVAANVEDRGQEEVWGIFDAIGSGKPGEALAKLDRLLHGAADPVAERLSFFSLLAAFCRQMGFVGGMLHAGAVRPDVRSFNRFKEEVAPILQRDLATGKSPVAGLHPFRLHRAYMAASRMSPGKLVGLSGRLLEAEMAVKGESRTPDAVLTSLVAELAVAAR